MTIRLSQLRNWRSALQAYIVECKNKPFSWDPESGSVAPSGLNCLTFAGGAIAVQTGVNPYTEIASIVPMQYTSKLEAYSMMATTFGVTNLQDLLDQFFEPKALVAASYGDIGLVPIGDSEPRLLACCVIIPPCIFCMDLNGGLLQLSLPSMCSVYDPLSFNIPDKYKYKGKD